jgi:hypothetical protein
VAWPYFPPNCLTGSEKHWLLVFTSLLVKTRYLSLTKLMLNEKIVANLTGRGYTVIRYLEELEVLRHQLKPSKENCLWE